MYVEIDDAYIHMYINKYIYICLCVFPFFHIIYKYMRTHTYPLRCIQRGCGGPTDGAPKDAHLEPGCKPEAWGLTPPGSRYF